MEEQFDKAYILELADKINNGSITEEQWQYYNRWYASVNKDILELPEGYADSDFVIRDRMHKNIKSYLVEEKAAQSKTTFPLWRYIIAAAAVLLLSLIGYYVYNLFLSHPGTETTMIKPEDIKPGGNNAILTLGNGKRIYLNDTKDGDIASESGTSIKKTKNGELEYTAQQNQPVTNTFNTIETPKGGQYQLRLPDGTKVWLNADSKLIYAVTLIGNGKREVRLSGEAYFQVAKDKEHPFVVKTATQDVTVLGTHFNINSYSDEVSTITTLEEGSVSVSTKGQEKIIAPGEQIINNGKVLKVQQAAMETVFAWKDGLFEFKDADVRTIMPQISRWYNIDVVYEGALPKDLITGAISRHSNLAAVLKIFEMLHLKFRLEDLNGRKTLIVSP
jgi:transmembrane sensor